MSGAAILVFCGEVAVLLGLCLLSDLVTQWLSLWGCWKTFIPARVAVGIGECAVSTTTSPCTSLADVISFYWSTCCCPLYILSTVGV